MPSIRTKLAIVAAGLLATTAAFAQQGTIELENVWSRAALAGRNGAVFMTIKDKGPTGDRLVSAASPVAERLEVHETTMADGVMKMREVKGLEVTPAKPLTLAPGGYHIMLMNLKQPLKEGDHFPVTLTFEKAGAVTATALVAKAGAPMPTMSHQHDMSHPQGGQAK
jgi:copper(I)-binding protein